MSRVLLPYEDAKTNEHELRKSSVRIVGLLWIIGLALVTGHASMTNRAAADRIFRFEDYNPKKYSTTKEAAKSARAALLEAYPIGTDISVVEQAVIDMGGTCTFYSKEAGKTWCRYSHSYSFFPWTAVDWQILISEAQRDAETGRVLGQPGATYNDVVVSVSLSGL